MRNVMMKTLIVGAMLLVTAGAASALDIGMNMTYRTPVSVTVEQALWYRADNVGGSGWTSISSEAGYVDAWNTARIKPAHILVQADAGTQVTVSITPLSLMCAAVSRVFSETLLVGGRPDKYITASEDLVGASTDAYTLTLADVTVGADGKYFVTLRPSDYRTDLPAGIYTGTITMSVDYSL